MTLFDEPGYQFKMATKNMIAAPVEIWLSSIHSILSLLLNWSSGTPSLRNNKSVHHNNHMSWVSLGKMPPAAQILLPCCQFQAEEAWQVYVVPAKWIWMMDFQIWIKIHNCSLKSLLINLVKHDLMKTCCLDCSSLDCAACLKHNKMRLTSRCFWW